MSRQSPAKKGFDSLDESAIRLEAGHSYEFVWPRKEIESQLKGLVWQRIALRLSPPLKVTTRRNASGTYTHIYDFTAPPGGE